MYEKSVALDPMSLIANYSYANGLAEIGRFEEAEKVIKQMAEVDPNSQFIQANYCQLRNLQYRYGEAAYFCKNCVAQYSDSRMLILYTLGNLYNQLGLYELIPAVFKATDMESVGYIFQPGKMDIAIKTIRAQFSRPGRDFVAAIIRANAEFFA
ncbi:MAG: tetratricopeptide (TPR) repeat protein [Candidatus Azotimanducaceae bacterium]|jgi:tetratricopeptide (TPR) repeat protein